MYRHAAIPLPCAVALSSWVFPAGSAGTCTSWLPNTVPLASRNTTVIATGAVGMAEDGYSFEQILEYYYRGIDLESWY